MLFKISRKLTSGVSTSSMYNFFLRTQNINHESIRKRPSINFKPIPMYPGHDYYLKPKEITYSTIDD